MIGVDADFGGDRERSGDDVFRVQFGVIEQRLGGSLCLRTTRTNRDETVFGFYHIAVATDDERGCFIGNGE